MADFNKNELAGRTQSHLNKYITAADQKASILLTGQFAFLGLSATAVQASLSAAGSLFFYLVIVTAVLGVIAVTLSVAVIYPRTPSVEGGFIYWDNILGHGSPENFREEFDALSASGIQEEMTTQNYMLSKVARRKYRSLRWSLVVTMGMVGCAIIAGAVFLS